MINNVLSKGIRFYHVGKAASVNTAIKRALRKSTPATKKPIKRQQGQDVWRTPTSRSRGFRPGQRYGGAYGQRSSGQSRFNIKDSTDTPEMRGQFSKFSSRPLFGEMIPVNRSSTFSERSSYEGTTTFARPSNVQERPTSISRDYPSLSPRGRPFKAKSSNGYSNETRRRVFSHAHKARDLSAEPSSPYQHPLGTSSHQESAPKPRETSFREPSSPIKFNQSSGQRAHKSTEQPRLTHAADKRMPLSIPYTTPASEFLYGTSVVEAALRSQRRKLYKLYIYSGENRESNERDNYLERLARKSGIEVVNVENDGLRLMEKLSSGRPHNGYILEASPLPRLPVKSLGQLTTGEGRMRYEVILGYQSREEAAINGTDNFVEEPAKNSRCPLVLLLDGIVDTGNLGSIIRSAAFLGVSAIAISTRNSAPFTPIVLKASAGASENVTLFSVSTPAGFIVDSRRAGWKVFAGVAPSRDNTTATPQSLSTDELGYPLFSSPSILMLGSEGEGLRWNLRSKADVEVYIQGCGQSCTVDSLNVGVAAGILCSAFLRNKESIDTSSTIVNSELKKVGLLNKSLF
ncbi:hypothetical protein EG329_008013 [Mollisiaceae sp. DMI_Dod_QoI]|nr:hypothetical protein EG329_008013 [Helotiales sp. DMI_Dod_QoI]